MSYKKNVIPVYVLKKTKERKPFLDKVDEIKYNDDDDFQYVDTIVEALESKFEVSYLYEERIYVVAYDRQLNPLGVMEASKGNSRGTKASCREITMFALLSGSDQIMMFHNHPSGILEISSDDERITERIATALKTVDISLSIHAVIADEDFHIFWEG